MPVAASSVAASIAISTAIKLAFELGPKVVTLAKQRAAKDTQQKPAGSSLVVKDYPCILPWTHGQEKWMKTSTQGHALALVMRHAIPTRVRIQEDALRMLKAGDTERGLLYLAVADLTGIPYQWGGQGTQGLDCSGSYLLMHQQLSQLGLIPPLRSYGDRTAASMLSQWHARSSPGPLLGDAVIYNGGGHVEMWLGNGIVFGANGGNSKNKRGIFSQKGFTRAKRYDYWSKLHSVRVPR